MKQNLIIVLLIAAAILLTLNLMEGRYPPTARASDCPDASEIARAVERRLDIEGTVKSVLNRCVVPEREGYLFC